MKTVSPSLKKLIKILNDGEFHSGGSLGKQLKISRNAIWKHINQLIKYNIAIESAQSKGYCLKQPLILLDKKIIKKQLTYSGSLAPDKIDIVGSIPSTNDYLKNNPAVNNTQPIYICLAEHQSAGKGRSGRSWHSPFGANIYLSCSWRITKDVSKLSGLTLVIALAIVNALASYGLHEPINLKWPNDILWQDKKLGGTLTEINAESHGSTQVIIGIGLNINMPLSADDKINRPWASLDSISPHYHDRNKIAAVLISHLLENLELFDEHGLSYFTDQWQRYDYLFGKNVTLNIGKENITGQAAGINQQGHLKIQHPDGSITTHSAGEASLHTGP
jgi:BirA family biotin operon repressor/biotin-[acetyl-CoA-carboxylase] ligase